MTAREFAIQAHGAQMYGELPYEAHLQAVRTVIVRFALSLNLTNGVFENLMDAAWLHDVMEDCDVRMIDLDEPFGERVANLVWAVTDGKGRNRAERKAASYFKIRNEVGRDAVILKLADRIANMEHSIAHHTRHLEMYRREFPAFEAALFVAGEADAMWEHLRAISTEAA